MQQVNLLRCKSIPMCRVVSITPPVVVVELPGGADVLCGGHPSPIPGLSRALRWRFSHRTDQSPLRGRHASDSRSSLGPVYSRGPRLEPTAGRAEHSYHLLMFHRTAI